MLHCICDCLFRSESPLHQEFLTLQRKLITECIANREGKWFPCMFHDRRSLQAPVTELQVTYVDLEEKLNVLQLSTQNATRAAALAPADSAAAWTRLIRA